MNCVLCHNFVICQKEGFTNCIDPKTKQMCDDLVIYGCYIEKGGKRICPTDVPIEDIKKTIEKGDIK